MRSRRLTIADLIFTVALIVLVNHFHDCHGFVLHQSPRCCHVVSSNPLVFSRDNDNTGPTKSAISAQINTYSNDQASRNISIECDFMIGLTRKITGYLATMLIGGTLLVPFHFEIQATQQPQFLPAIRVEQSCAYALNEGQILVADVWKEVTRQYVDTTYNGLGEEGWKQRRLTAVKSVANAGPDDKDMVYQAIRDMLGALGDPYTRFLTPAQYDSLTAYARGGSAGIGISLVVDPTSERVVVASIVQGGPADKAGVLSGDIIEEIDGMDVKASTAEVVAAKCRGELGTSVNLAVRHGRDGNVDPKVTQLTITRDQVRVNPVQTSVLTFSKEQKIGVLKIGAFNQQTPSQIVEGLRKVRDDSVSGVVIDLRGNVGGYMPAGVDVAKLFLPSQARIISEIDKSGRKTIYIADGIGSETQLPLYLLVDRKTASASEIFAAALQDNSRATVIGEKTFGKGRIQNVQPLEDGSGVSVTKAKYVTPNGKDIHGVGILPDKVPKSCGPSDSPQVCLANLL